MKKINYTKEQKGGKCLVRPHLGMSSRQMDLWQLFHPATSPEKLWNAMLGYNNVNTECQLQDKERILRQGNTQCKVFGSIRVLKS